MLTYRAPPSPYPAAWVLESVPGSPGRFQVPAGSYLLNKSQTGAHPYGQEHKNNQREQIYEQGSEQQTPIVVSHASLKVPVDGLRAIVHPHLGNTRGIFLGVSPPRRQRDVHHIHGVRHRVPTDVPLEIGSALIMVVLLTGHLQSVHVRLRDDTHVHKVFLGEVARHPPLEVQHAHMEPALVLLHPKVGRFDLRYHHIQGPGHRVRESQEQDGQDREHQHRLHGSEGPLLGSAHRSGLAAAVLR